MQNTSEKRLGQGYYWQELNEGNILKTFRRTVTETDLVNFISVTGMLEELFIDASHQSGPVTGRLVPAALTYSLIEGMLLTTMIQGTGLALLETHMKAVAPVLVGDTIYATVEVTDLRPTTKNNRAIVTSQVEVYKQDDSAVLSYKVVRMLAGDPAKAA